MPGPVPGIHVFRATREDVDGWAGQAWTSPAMTWRKRDSPYALLNAETKTGAASATALNE